MLSPFTEITLRTRGMPVNSLLKCEHGPKIERNWVKVQECDTEVRW